MAMISREIPLGDAMAVVIAKNAAIVGTVKGQGILETVGPKVISGKSHTSQAGLIRMSHLGRAGLRFSRASTDCIATFDSEMPLS